MSSHEKATTLDVSYFYSKISILSSKKWSKILSKEQTYSIPQNTNARSVKEKKKKPSSIKIRTMDKFTSMQSGSFIWAKQLLDFDKSRIHQKVNMRKLKRGTFACITLNVYLKIISHISFSFVDPTFHFTFDMFSFFLPIHFRIVLYVFFFVVDRFHLILNICLFSIRNRVKLNIG